jgi:hypothetical protein
MGGLLSPAPPSAILGLLNAPNIDKDRLSRH